MSSVPVEPEAPPQRELYMHEVYSRARLASTDKAVCRYCEGMALVTEPCNGPSPLPVHQLFARIGDKGSPAQQFHEAVAVAVMKVDGEPLLYGELPDSGVNLRGFRSVNPQPVTLEHAIVWSNIVGLYLAQGARPQAQQFAYELHVILLELRRLGPSKRIDGEALSAAAAEPGYRAPMPYECDPASPCELHKPCAKHE